MEEGARMQYQQYLLFSDEDEVALDDEIDSLFNQLQQIEPPEWLIQRILTSVSQLFQLQPLPSVPWNRYDGLVVRNDDAEPS